MNKYETFEKGYICGYKKALKGLIKGLEDSREDIPNPNDPKSNEYDRGQYELINSIIKAVKISEVNVTKDLS